jgi:UDP-N-acetyl-D-mannosaminuronic acid transferase (WecB/TagA/CpsF family)
MQATKQQTGEALQAHVQQQAQQVLALGAQLTAVQQHAEVAQQQAQLKLAGVQQGVQESAAKLAEVLAERSQLQEDFGR